MRSVTDHLRRVGSSVRWTAIGSLVASAALLGASTSLGSTESVEVAAVTRCALNDLDGSLRTASCTTHTVDHAAGATAHGRTARGADAVVLAPAGHRWANGLRAPLRC